MANQCDDAHVCEAASGGVTGKTISCLQFTGKCSEAMEVYKIIGYGNGAWSYTPGSLADCGIRMEVFGGSAMHVDKTPDDRHAFHASIILPDNVMIMAWDDALAMKECTQRSGMHYLTVDDIQSTYKKALEKGFKQVPSMCCPSTNGPDDMWWGDTSVALQDPYGHLWILGQPHSHALDSPEMKAKEKAWMANYDGL